LMCRGEDSKWLPKVGWGPGDGVAGAEHVGDGLADAADGGGQGAGESAGHGGGGRG